MLSSSSMLSMPTVRLILRGRGGFLAMMTFWNAKQARRAVRDEVLDRRTSVWYAL